MVAGASSRGSTRCRACRARSCPRQGARARVPQLLVYLIPIAAVVCIGLLLSTITRNSAAAVVGTLMVSLLFQLIGILPGLGASAYLLSTQFNAWQGLLRQPIDWSPIVRAAWVCAMYGRAGARDRIPRVPAPRRRRWMTRAAAARPGARGRRRSAAAADAGADAGRRGVRGNGRRGRRAALAGPSAAAPDVIVLDVAMPALDGLAVSRRLRGKGLPTPILMLTARDAVVRSGRRARGRRRRLPRQAVRDPGADRAPASAHPPGATPPMGCSPTAI